MEVLQTNAQHENDNKTTKNSPLAGKLLGKSRWPEESLRGLLGKIMGEWECTFKKIKIDLNKQNFLIKQVRSPK